jgi:Sulfotransferase family
MTNESRETSATPPGFGSAPLWLFIHVPKTAGSSLRAAIADQLQPNYNINIDATGSAMTRDEAFKAEIEKFIALDKGQPFAFASGHVKMDEALHIRNAVGRPVKFITMLREPVRRVISEFRYQCTPAHPDHQEFRQRYPTVESYVEDPHSQNKMFRHLALREETVPATCARLEADFAFVGVVEMYPLAVKQFSKIIGARIAAGTRARVTEATEHNAVDVTNELTRTIRQLNPLDEQLWRHFRDLMRALRSSGEHVEAPEAATTPKTEPQDPNYEIARLRRENERLRAECETLKQSIAALSESRK